jgi:hypothetical protein
VISGERFAAVASSLRFSLPHLPLFVIVVVDYGDGGGGGGVGGWVSHRIGGGAPPDPPRGRLGSRGGHPKGGKFLLISKLNLCRGEKRSDE